MPVDLPYPLTCLAVPGSRTIYCSGKPTVDAVAAEVKRAALALEFHPSLEPAFLETARVLLSIIGSE